MNKLLDSLSQRVPTSLQGSIYESIYKDYLTYLDSKIGKELSSLENIRSSENSSDSVVLSNLKLIGFNLSCLHKIDKSKIREILDYLPTLYSKKGRGCLSIMDSDLYTSKYITDETDMSDHQHKFILDKSFLNRNTVLY
ncbi:MAG: hypothetical protein E6R13_08185 [Spirochaetes bacterium]|nr:MAG: hypothetical protein E6R13_08185 [Spirochaetota bacterium]